MELARQAARVPWEQGHGSRGASGQDRAAVASRQWGGVPGGKNGQWAGGVSR